MALLSTIVGGAIHAVVGPGGRRLLSGLIRRRQKRLLGSTVPHLFLQVDDPYSYLLLQIVWSAQEHFSELTGIVVGTPDEDVNPQPELARQYSQRDAMLLADFYGLEFPDSSNIRPEPQMLAKANRILLHTSTQDFLSVARICCRAYWYGDAHLLDEYDKAEGMCHSIEHVNGALRKNSQILRELWHYRGGTLLANGQWYWSVDRIGHFLPELAPQPVATHSLQGNEDRPDSMDLYFSFRSPYSYLALERAKQICEDAAIDLVIRPVLPMVLRGLPVPTIKKLYIVADTKREAEKLGIPFGKLCDPIKGGGVERCFSLVPYAASQGRLYDYVLSVSRGIWSEAANVRNDNDLQHLVTRAGLDWELAKNHLGSSDWQELASTNRDALFKLGMWGVPSFHVGSFSTWGQDRLPMVEAYLTG